MWALGFLGCRVFGCRVWAVGFLGFRVFMALYGLGLAWVRALEL